MSTVIKRVLTRNTDSWLAFANSLDCPLITTDDLYIYIADVFKFQIGNAGSLQLFVNDEEIPISPNVNPFVDAAGSTVIVACNPNFVWFTIQSPSSELRTIMMFYEIVSDKLLFAYKISQGVNFANLGNLKDKASIYEYVHGSRLNFYSSIGTIKYAWDVLFQYGNPIIKTVLDTNFLACSTVTQGQIITFNMHDYYSISSNILVPIDLEDET